MKYRIVQYVDGHMVVTDFSEEQLLPAMEVRGFEVVKLADRPSLRPELQGQPIFGKLCGLMWGGVEDGEAVVRYEDQQVNDIMST